MGISVSRASMFCLGLFILRNGGEMVSWYRGEDGSVVFLLQTCRPARLGTQTPATCRWKMAPRMGGFLISVTRVTVRSSYLVRDMRNCVGYCYFWVALFWRVTDVIVRD